jgi:hypothetical protein
MFFSRTRTYFIPFFIEVTVTTKNVLAPNLTVSSRKFESVEIKPLCGTGLLLATILLVKAWS